MNKKGILCVVATVIIALGVVLKIQSDHQEYVLTEEEYAIAVSKGNETLLASLNEFINLIKEDGTLDSIVSEYYGEDK